MEGDGLCVMLGSGGVRGFVAGDEGCGAPGAQPNDLRPEYWDQCVCSTK